MFDRFRKEAPELQLYGKLPLAKDYLRVGASKGAGRDLREWLDYAFSSRAVQGAPPRFAWPARFVLGAVPGEPLMGTVWPSSDTGGERDFPFTLFVTRRRAALVKALLEGLAGLEPMWRELSACHASIERFSDGLAFLAEMRGRAFSVDEPTPATGGPAERIPWDAWVSALWPKDKQAGLVKVLVSLAELRQSDSSGALRLPLVANRPALPQVHGWWSALVGLKLVRPGEVPSVFFPLQDLSGREPAFVLFLTQPLGHQHVEWLGSTRAQARLGPGDFATSLPALSPPTPTTENTPDLAVSMRGALATARARQ